MTVEQLRFFKTLEEYRNFSVAAEKCFISQSSLSKYIKSLEDEIGGVLLFDRSGKKVELTEAGRDFSLYAGQMLRIYDEMHTAMKKHSHTSMELIEVGSIPVTNHYGLTEVFFAFQKAWPNIRISVEEDNSKPIKDQYETKRLNVVFLRENCLPSGDDYYAFPIIDDRFVLVTAKEHKLAAYGEIDLEMAKEDNFLFLGRHTGMNETCRNECLKAGFIPHGQDMNVRSSTIENLVAHGQGVALMMQKSIEFFHDDRVAIIPYHDAATIRIMLVVRKKAMTDAISAFVEYVRDSYGRLED